jgi:membrane protein implicated in regulation of membrane protease activity
MIGGPGAKLDATPEAGGEFILLLNAFEPLHVNVMKNLANYFFPVFLIIIGGALLIVGAMQGQNSWVMLGAGLALLAGVVSMLLQMGILNRKMGTVIGLVFAVVAIGLAYRNYRSVAELLEFNERKAKSDRLVIQALKDIRTAQIGYRQASGAYTGNLDVLKEFVKTGTIPMVKAIGQIPDTLTEQQALELKLIVRDTILAPALDSLFLSPRAQEGRVYPFDVNTFTNSPASDKPFLLKAGVINSSGRSIPVFMARDPQPMVAGDTLLVGNMEKASTAGNWTGE